MQKFNLFFSLVTLVILQAFSASAQKSTELMPYKIRLKVNGVKDSTVYLANYFGNKLFYNDTAKADANGYFEFDGKPYDEGGKYAVVLPGPKFFDILVSNEEIHLETDANDFIGKMKVIESQENKTFFDYIHFIESKKSVRQPLDKILQDENAPESKKKEAQADLDKLNKEVVAYQHKMIEEHPTLLAAKLVQMTIDIEIPEPPADTEDKNWKYHYYMDHYWDNVDLKDPRIVRDQIIQKKLDHFINTAVPQIPDTVVVEAKKFIEKTKGNSELFKYCVHYITSNAEKSKIMCMDKVFVAMVDAYYSTGMANWTEDEQLKRITEAAEDKRYTLCGEIAPNVILPDTTDKNWVSLHGIEAEYTILIIWESNCGHCKKEMPKLQELYHKWKPEGVEVFAIGNDFETKEWKEFVKKKDLDWYNVSDNPQINNSDSALVLIRAGITTLASLNFRKTFDVFSTPKIYLLDKEKKIIAKQLQSEQIEDLLNKLYGREEKTDEKSKSDKPKKEKKGNKSAKEEDVKADMSLKEKG